MQKEMLVRALDQDVEIHLTRGRNMEGCLASHFHCAYTMGVIERGLVEMTYEDKQVKLSGGAFYVMNPFSIHRMKFLRPTDYCVMNLKIEVVKNLVRHFSVESIGKQNEQIASALLEAYQELASTKGNFIQKQTMMKYVLEMLENEQALCF